MENGLEKKFGLMTAICMVVGICIGSGVFFKAQVILQATNGNMPLGILAWVIGGLIMLFASLAFAVMATKYEKVNGIVDYAEATVSGKYAYIVGWFMTTIYYPTLTSVLAWLSARYTLVFIQSVNPDIKLTEGGPVNGVEVMVLSVFFIAAAYAVNALSPKLAGKFQVGTTAIKLVPLVLMAVIGLIYGLSTGNLAANFTTTAAMQSTTSSVTTSPLFASVVATSFAYEGWIIATSINAELKDAKKNLPKALLIGAIIVIAVYIFYYIGVAGGASNKDIMNHGAAVAFINVFGNVFGNILNLFVAISCMGTLNGLMLGCTRGMYSVAARGEGPKPEMFSQINKYTNMPTNSSILGLFFVAVWFVYFYGANLAPFQWWGVFSFDSSELPIVTTYALYIPIFIGFMKKATDVSSFKRYILPTLAVISSAFMIFAAIFAHGIRPYLEAKAAGGFAIPIVFYLILFAVIMLVGVLLNRKNSAAAESGSFADKAA